MKEIRRKVQVEHDHKQYYAITTSMTFEKTVLVPVNSVKNFEEAVDLVDCGVEMNSIDLLNEKATCETKAVSWADNNGIASISEAMASRFEIVGVNETWVDNIKITPLTAIHCETEEQAMFLLNIAEKQGWTWGSKDALTSRTNFETYGKRTVYTFESSGRDVLFTELGEPGLEEENFTVISFNSFLAGSAEYDKTFNDLEFLQPISKALALELWTLDFCPIYKLYDHDETEAMVDSLGEIKAFDGWVAVEREDWNRYIKTQVYSDMPKNTL